MKIAICDDALTCVNDIKKLLSDTGVTLPECDVFHSGEALLADFADSPFKYANGDGGRANGDVPVFASF